MNQLPWLWLKHAAWCSLCWTCHKQYKDLPIWPSETLNNLCGNGELSWTLPKFNSKIKGSSTVMSHIFHNTNHVSVSYIIQCTQHSGKNMCTRVNMRFYFKKMNRTLLLIKHFHHIWRMKDLVHKHTVQMGKYIFALKETSDISDLGEGGQQ